MELLDFIGRFNEWHQTFCQAEENILQSKKEKCDISKVMRNEAVLNCHEKRERSERENQLMDRIRMGSGRQGWGRVCYQHNW